MERPSVTFINRVYPPVRGASGRVLRDLAKAFSKEGWQVNVITTGPFKTTNERDGAIRVIRVKGPEKPANMISYAIVWLKLFIAAFRAPKTKLVVTLTDPPFAVSIGYMLKKFRGMRHINWCQDLYPDIFPALGLRFPRWVQNTLQSLGHRTMTASDKIIVVGRCMAKTLTQKGYDPRLITVIPNWPDAELVKAPANGNINGAEQITLKDGFNGTKAYDEQYKSDPKFRILYAGNIGLSHPVGPIIEAAELLDKTNPEIEFVFVGDGPRFDQLAYERQQRGLNNMRFLPYQPLTKLREVMESGDVHLISMKEETAGMLVPSKLYASLAVQRPLIFIGPEQSETAKVINDFGAGVVIPQDRPDLLADAIKAYRYNGQQWFTACDGAADASQAYVPDGSIDAWINRAWSVVQKDLQTA